MEKLYRALIYIKNNHHIYHKKAGILLLLISVSITSLFLLNLTRKSASSATITFIQSWGVQGSGHGQFESPQGIAFDSTGNIYVAEGTNNRIQKFDSNGSYLTQWGVPGDKNGQFSNPQAIAIDRDNYVYVADSSNNRIQVFDSSGNFVKAWGSYGAGDGNLSQPSGIAIDTSKNIYVADLGNYRIQVFDSNGNYIRQWGSVGSGDGEFDSPQNITIDPWGNVFVSDFGNNRIEEFDNEGNFITKFTGFTRPTGITSDSNGVLYILDYQHSKATRFDPNRNNRTDWGSEGTADGEFSQPMGIGINPNGHIFVVDTGNNRIEEFSASYDNGKYNSNADTSAYQGIAAIHTLVKVGDKIYVGGANGLEIIDATSGTKIPWNFNSPINNQTATYSGVWALAYSPDTQTLYAGTANGLDAYDLSSGTGTYFWSADIHLGEDSQPQIRALSIIGSILYMGGEFDTVETQNRLNLASFDISNPTPTITNFKADAGAEFGPVVYTLKEGGGNLYVGGFFDFIGGINQQNLAMVDLSGSATISATFRPQFDQGNFPVVHSLEYYNGQLYVGGRFNKLGGSNLTNLGRVDALTGIEDSTWNHPTDNPVYALSVKDDYLFIGESSQISQYFDSGASDGNAFALNLTTDVETDWSPQDTQGIHVFLPTDDILYVGLVGQFIPQSNNINRTIDFVKNIFAPKKVYADIGGLTDYIYLAIFRRFNPSPTLTPAPTLTPTPAPTATPSATATPGPTATLTPTPTAAAGTSVGTSSSSFVNNPDSTTSLPKTGPGDILKVGFVGVALLIIGGLVLIL